MNRMMWYSFCVYIVTAALSVDAADLLIRPKNFIVTPSTGPVAEVVVKNNTDAVYKGTITPSYPQGWIVSPLSQSVELAGGESKTLSFAIESGSDLKENRYEVSISAENQPTLKTHVVCASAPYFKPEIDGKLDEWNDAIPVTFVTSGKTTTVRSYWNKAQFCLAVEVEEDALNGLASDAVDAIQFSIAPGKSVTATDPSAESMRYEYIVAASGSRWKGDKCFQILSPGEPLSTAKEARDLQPLELEEAQVEIKHADGITRYELSVPMKPMKTLRATAGREYCFSLLVHDPDGTGLRDLGTIMNAWESSRNPLAWCNWDGAHWNEIIPFDNKVEFGFCSSIH